MKSPEPVGLHGVFVSAHQKRNFRASAYSAKPKNRHATRTTANPATLPIMNRPDFQKGHATATAASRGSTEASAIRPQFVARSTGLPTTAGALMLHRMAALGVRDSQRRKLCGV